MAYAQADSTYFEERSGRLDYQDGDTFRGNPTRRDNCREQNCPAVGSRNTTGARSTDPARTRRLCAKDSVQGNDRHQAEAQRRGAGIPAASWARSFGYRVGEGKRDSGEHTRVTSDNRNDEAGGAPIGSRSILRE